MTKRTRIAIIGAGITGVHLGSRLSAVADVKLFEKSRGIGGRMSTRRAEGFQFDHGAQYFTAHSKAFKEMLAPHIAAGRVAAWKPRLTSLGQGGATPVWTAPRFVAVPGMNALCKAMAEGLDIALQTRIAQFAKTPAGRWTLTSEAGEPCGDFDWVVSTAPAEQTLRLMPDCFQETTPLAKAQMLGCYSLMLGGLDLSDLGWDAAVVHDSPLSWVAVNHTKPGRADASSLMCQSSNLWAETHMEDPSGEVQDALLKTLRDVTGIAGEKATYISLHKWRFAKVDKTPAKPYLLDRTNGLAAAGDWCGAGRVEAGFESAEALAAEMCKNI